MIPTVPSCTEEDPCDALSLVSLGKGLEVSDPTSECSKLLTGEGIPVQDAFGVSLKTGAATNPIKTPLMQVLEEGSFPFIMLMNKAGAWFRLKANQTGKRFVISSKNGSFFLEELLSEPCFDEADVCDGCEPDFIAGIKVTDGVACLIKLPLSVTTDFWESSNCIEITGSGTEEDPYIPSVIISEEADNIIQCLDDGLFAAAPSS